MLLVFTLNLSFNQISLERQWWQNDIDDDDGAQDAQI